MKKLFLTPRPAADALAGALCLALALPAFALSTDKNQPIEVEADEVELDEPNRISTYQGNIVVKQGSIRMTGERMTVHSTRDDLLELMVLEGKPATYQQLPDDSETPDQAAALRMEFHDLKNLIVLIGEAWIKKGEGTATLAGERIEYDTELSRVKATSTPGSGEDSRVKLIFKRDKQDE